MSSSPSFVGTGKSISDVLKDLDLPVTLQQRVNISVDSTSVTPNENSFVLYLPTVVLRRQHNPALALACRLANHYQVPLLILCVVLDDAHYPLTTSIGIQQNNEDGIKRTPVVATARRLTFVLQALQAAATEWTELGATVLTRVHGTAARTPHHLTLARVALAVVTDEPFVHPFRNFACTTERACRSSQPPTPCIRVDGSTTVAPVCKLRRNADGITWSGVPTKAWMWEKSTKPKRSGQIYGTVKDGHLDAPPLIIQGKEAELRLNGIFPNDWLDSSTPAPGKRPWTVSELLNIIPEEWSLSWPGVDPSVPPCSQTHGAKGWDRWEQFKQSGGLAKYAKRRNDIKQPHAVSRLSCYLNMGTISIFQIIYELWELKANTVKFEDEIIKWREIGYAHTFAYENYFSSAVVPRWARDWWILKNSASLQTRDGGKSVSFRDMELAQTSDATWNAMQSYLNTTGELHNNARMTWGKTILHWLVASASDIDEALQSMAYLNDRFALDGVSPPSYAGLLWCWGWCDKPGSGGGISTKWASRYRTGPEGFLEGKRHLLAMQNHQSVTAMLLQHSPNNEMSKNLQLNKKPRLISNSHAKADTRKIVQKFEAGNILSYFTPPPKKAIAKEFAESKTDDSNHVLDGKKRQIVG